MSHNKEVRVCNHCYQFLSPDSTNEYNSKDDDVDEDIEDRFRGATIDKVNIADVCTYEYLERSGVRSSKFGSSKVLDTRAKLDKITVENPIQKLQK